ncbi:DUF2252 family protein [Bdellovibrio sp. HCB209]|uniref:DUF2252 family protein n=1 Tax=Bdellovibrio sp. HCB209 TaxID=3394354 RepID=UPI0039B37587
MKALFLTLAMTFFCAAPASAQLNAFTMSADWNHQDGLFNAFRANAPHYWNWLKSQNSPMLSPMGIVVGDPHIQNFGDVQLASGGREFALNDIDDGGPQAPLAGDLIRYAAGNQVSPFAISTKDIFQAYLQGLQGKAVAEPEILQEALSHSDADYFKRQSKYLTKMTDQNRFSAKAKLTPISQAPASVQELYEKSRSAFEASMSGYQILDVGYRTKLSGGSQGLPRFWYLIQRNQERYIVEFKLQTQAATSFYLYQGEPAQRFPYIEQVYRPAHNAYGPYKIVTTEGGAFLMRARLNPYLDFDPEEVDSNGSLDDGKKMSLYIANRLGLWHGGQSASTTLLQVLNFNDFDSLVKNYVNLMTKENN